MSAEGGGGQLQQFGAAPGTPWRRKEVIGDATLYLGDCMEILPMISDHAFNLAIVDPPYGDAGGKVNHAFGGKAFAKYAPLEGGSFSHDIRHWDIAPPQEYFDELFRVSAHQVIWGGNYFPLPPSRNFLIWRKPNISESFSMAMAEYAWTSIPGNSKVFECAPQDATRFHPTQKPVALYRWILGMYAMNGDVILDTHMGSGSLVVACAELGYKITAIEINEEYFNKACKRIEIAYQQPRLFDEPRPKAKPQELGL